MTEADQHRSFVAERWPELGVDTFVPFEGGWECFTYLVNGVWVFQFPRLPDSGERLRMQIAVLPEVAREVSSAVPVPVYASTDPVCMGYRLIAGRPMSATVDGIWPEPWVASSTICTWCRLSSWGCEHLGRERSRRSPGRDRFARRARPPLLDADERARVEQTITTFLDDDDNFRFAPCLTHGDIGPEHVLITEAGDLAGVIDWGDLEVGDPVFDLAWVLNAMPAVGERVLGAYGGPPDERFLARSRFAFMLMPWHEVKYGVDTGQDAYVRGLDAVRQRLL